MGLGDDLMITSFVEQEKNKCQTNPAKQRQEGMERFCEVTFQLH